VLHLERTPPAGGLFLTSIGEVGAVNAVNELDMPSRSIQVLARRVLVVEAASKRANEAHLHEAVRVCEKLKTSLTRFAGADGFASLMRRTLAMARVDVPSLSHVTLKPDCSMEGLETLAAQDPHRGVEAGTAIIAHLLGLLITFIGQPLTLRLVQESWPYASLDESH
jgi:hypothetical protein